MSKHVQLAATATFLKMTMRKKRGVKKEDPWSSHRENVKGKYFWVLRYKGRIAHKEPWNPRDSMSIRSRAKNVVRETRVTASGGVLRKHNITPETFNTYDVPVGINKSFAIKYFADLTYLHPPTGRTERITVFHSENYTVTRGGTIRLSGRTKSNVVSLHQRTLNRESLKIITEQLKEQAVRNGQSILGGSDWVVKKFHEEKVTVFTKI